MGILDYFTDMPMVTVQHQIPSTAIDSARRPTESFANNGATFSAWKWVDTSIETSQNNALVDNQVGTIIIDPSVVSLSFNVGDKLVISSTDFYIVGIDPDIFQHEEVTAITYRREYAKRN